MRSETARKSFYFNESKLFNDIPNEMKDLNSVMVFKPRILEFYRSKAFLELFLKLEAVYMLFRFFRLFSFLQGPY